MLRARFLTPVLAALLAVCALPAAAQEQVANPPDPWVHAATGTKFPAAVGSFERRQILEFSEDGRDAGVNYYLARGDEWLNVSLYIYPVIAGLDCKATFEGAKGDIATYRGARLLSEGLDQAPRGRGGPVAFHAGYLLPAGSVRDDLPTLRSDVYLYCPAGGEWLVKYRASWTEGEDFAEDVGKLLHSIEWPANLGG